MGSRRQIRTCTTGTNQVSSSKYDQAGNISGLPPGYGFSYDAENRITAESNAGGLSASYYYDGVGHRVEKVLSNGQATVYVYDVFGRLAEEYSPANSWSKDYVPFNGQTVAIENASASPCATCYLNYDNLGTVRMVTDGSASVITRHDYLPFGDEIPAGSAGRNSQFGPYADNVDQKFTGQVRDAETANDFFNARYYTAPLMRFLSPDPGNMGADPTDPQTWNAYAYVRNNPLALVDPSGMDPITFTTTSICGGPCAPGAIGVTYTGDFTFGDGFSANRSPLVPLDAPGEITFSITHTAKADVLTVSTPSNQQLVPPKSEACPGGATAAGLTYPPGVRQHIEQRHMYLLSNGSGTGNNFPSFNRNGVNLPASQYVF